MRDIDCWKGADILQIINGVEHNGIIGGFVLATNSSQHNREDSEKAEALQPTQSKTDTCMFQHYLLDRDILAGRLTLTGLNRCSVSVSELSLSYEDNSQYSVVMLVLVTQ